MYPSSCFPSERYARFLLPFSGSLGSHFPTFSAYLCLRYYDPLRPPFCHLGLLRFRSPPDTLLNFALFCVLVRLFKKNAACLARCSGENRPELRPAFFLTDWLWFRYFFSQGTNGSLKFPDYPYVHMPRSQSPVVSLTLALAR